MIDSNTQVEEIMKIPGVVSYFIENRVSPITCSGPFPQPLGKLLELKKVADPDAFIAGLNDFLTERGIELKEDNE
ncbi:MULTISPECIES: hypothetical protein [Sediminispirochaeta]|jgi:hypothetical protein|uniref:DUF1858 domain-containing protein n=1 Tax=Sediminispirochaeta smaragdinae (strain DSM 11293 / JCM 15392 / SEBR 4228) TaxID=573413 RepID=E1R4K5_SEDSS|nr:MULTISPECIES: hypothetical protein [Sediminispirochaeta]ADK81746.1 hypothetical protein Spirs_2637 [Sediminispirochaeta smaragdinae DSM 11293]